MTSILSQAAARNTRSRLRRPSSLSQHFVTSHPHQKPLARCFSLFMDFDPVESKLDNSKDDNNSNRKRKDKKKKSGKPSYRFVDRVRVRASAGEGGKGSLSMHSIGRKRKLKPDGGNGGDGGSIIIFADPKEQSLRMSHPHVQAPKGANGSNNDKHGRKGKNTVIRVPCGVVVKRILNHDEVWDENTETVKKVDENGEEIQPALFNYYDPDYEYNDITTERNGGAEDGEEAIDYDMVGFSDMDVLHGTWKGSDDEDDDRYASVVERERVVLADLDTPSSHVVVCKGGKGGFGTGIFSSFHGKLPDAQILARYARPQPGEVAYLELELKLIADIGLVGFPNAGKSSLLCAMSRAAPQVAPYPFTTLNPFVGVMEYRDAFNLKVADIPGLIDGASEGRGEGHDFLRHLERTKALLYIVDAAGTEGRDPVEDLKILTNELASYGDGDMMNRKALVVANKLDLLDEDEQTKVLSRLEDAAQEVGIQIHSHVLGISAGVTGLGLGTLAQEMRGVLHSSQAKRECI